MDKCAGKNASTGESDKTEEKSNCIVIESGVLSNSNTDPSATGDVTVKEENGVDQLKTETQSDVSVMPSTSVDLTVFVGKLSDRVTPEELKKFFTRETKSEDGEVLGVNMPWKVVKKSKKLGIAFVDFANQRAYQAALTLNSIPLHGQNILVLPAANTHQGLLLMDGPEGEAKDSADDTVKSKNATGYVPVYKKSDHVAYIKNLPHGVSEDEVLEFFKFTRQDIVDIAIPIPFKAKRNAKRPVRAIIAFPSEESLEKCLAQTKTMYRDREVVVERHQMVSKVVVGEKRAASDAKDANETASPEKQSRTIVSTEITGQVELDLFVKHIPREASDRQIKDFFGSAGATVLKVNLFAESITGSTRGMGFVSMADKESLQKGLQLDCKRFYKNKVRVSIRRDREHLERPGEVQPNYSTFIGNLPIKEKPETLKEAITKHFQEAECSVKNVYLPLVTTRSGNKGYAFISFENEDSLKKGQGLNNSELKLLNNKVTISVSDRWPENPSDVGGGDNKGKDRNAERGAPNSQQEPPGIGKQRKRKKGLPLAGGPQGPPGPQGHQVPIDFMGPQQNRWNTPQEFQPGGQEFGGYNNDYQDYLDYLEYRDYMTVRKAYDERRELAEFRARYRAECEEEFIQQQQQPPPTMPPPLAPPPPPPPAPPAPATQGPGGPGYSRPTSSIRKDGRLDDNYRIPGPFPSSGRRDRGYEDIPSASGSLAGSRSRDYHEFDFIPARGGAGDAGAFSNSQSGNVGGGGSGTSGGGGSGGGGGGSGNSSYLASEQRGPGGYNYSDSFSSSLSSSRYQTADSSFSRSRLHDNSNVGSSTLGFSRNSGTTFRDSTNGIDSSSRGVVSNYNSGFPTGGGNSGGDVRGSHTLSGASGSSNLRSSALDSGRSQYGLMSYSGLNRAASSYSGGVGENTGFVGSSTSGSYSGADMSQRYSFSSNSSMPPLQGDRHRYSGYSGSSGEPLDQYRKGSQYDKSESSVSRLASSSLMTNSGYDGYPNLSGYRAG